MTTEVQTQTGRCSTRGTVQATREVPKMGLGAALVKGLLTWRSLSVTCTTAKPSRRCHSPGVTSSDS